MASAYVLSSKPPRRTPEGADKVAVVAIVATMATIVILATGSADAVIDLAPLLLGILTVLYAPLPSRARSNRKRP